MFHFAQFKCSNGPHIQRAFMKKGPFNQHCARINYTIAIVSSPMWCASRPCICHRFFIDLDLTTMIKTKKILHLRRYLTLIVRSQLCSPLCETMGNRSPRRGGYVLDVHSRHASLRPEIYVATCNRMYSTECTTVLHSSPSDVDHKLTSFCENIKKGQVSADDLREIVNLCNKNDYLLPHSIGVLLLKCCRNLLSDLEAAKRNHLMNQVQHNYILRYNYTRVYKVCQ